MSVPPIDAAQADRFLSLLGKEPATARLRAFPHRDNPNKWHPEHRPHGLKARKGPYDLAAASRWQQEGRRRLDRRPPAQASSAGWIPLIAINTGG